MLWLSYFSFDLRQFFPGYKTFTNRGKDKVNLKFIIFASNNKSLIDITPKLSEKCQLNASMQFTSPKPSDYIIKTE